jgi:hypothetical protein
MEQQILQLRNLSSDLIERLAECRFEEIEAYMDARNKIFEEMAHLNVDRAVNDQLTAEVKLFLAMDHKILTRMQQMYSELGAELHKIQSGKKNKSTYDNFNHGPEESYFFDSKK